MRIAGGCECKLMKRAGRMVGALVWLAILAMGGKAAAGDIVISTFANFKLDTLYAAWTSATIASTGSNYQVSASGYGSGYAALEPSVDASGATSIELTVTITGPSGVISGPIVSLVDRYGTFVDFAWYGQAAGRHVLKMDLSAGAPKPPAKAAALDLSHLGSFHLQNDPGKYSGQYTVTFEKLRLIGPADSPPTASLPAASAPQIPKQ